MVQFQRQLKSEALVTYSSYMIGDPPPLTTVLELALYNQSCKSILVSHRMQRKHESTLIREAPRESQNKYLPVSRKVQRNARTKILFSRKL